MKPPSFADCATEGCPGYADLALAVAGEFREIDGHAAARSLDRHTARLPAMGDRRPLDQLEAVRAPIAAGFAQPPRRPAGDADLMLDAVLATRTGQPVMVAVIAAEIGTRAGVRLGIVSNGRRHFVAHRHATVPLLIDLASPRRLRHAHELETDLNWHCAHQVACALLQTLLCRALNAGDLARAIRAAELKLALPFDPRTRTRAQHELRALRAYLN